MDPFYRLTKDIVDDIDIYSNEVDRFKTGEVSPEKFRPFRVARGIYAQRGQKRFMVRIKVPGGGLTPDQMVRIAETSKKLGNGIPHVTTRQDVQLHYVTIEDTVKAMKSLSEVSLTTKGGGGNTVRNVTACYDAGVCDLEVFDVSPYAPAFTEFFLNHPKAFNLPRKFKIAFSGCPDDCSLATINDVGFIAKKKVIDGVEKRGFRVYAAGGMGAVSRVTDLIEDFIPEEEAIYVAEAFMLLFDKHGNRKDKHKARLRFVIDRVGREEFLRLYREELAAVKALGPKKIDLRPRPQPEGDISSESSDVPLNSDAAFNGWFKTNVRPQLQKGYHYAKIRLTLGDISSENFIKLADTVREFGEGTIRTTHDQNIVVRWLAGKELYPFYKTLLDIGLAEQGAGGVSDVLSCPGASTCNLGICLSKNMSTELTTVLEGNGLDLTSMDDVRVMISGCNNSCGQHPVAPIGLHGAARRGSGRMAPHYQVLLGGRVEEGKTVLGEEFGFVPAKKTTLLIKEFLTDYDATKKGDEDFYAWLERHGKARMREMIKDYPLPSYEEDPSCYTDWGTDEEFSLAGLGPGECGAGVLDMVEADIDEGKMHISKAKKDLSRGNHVDGSDSLTKALSFTTKALLLTRGIEPVDDYLSATDFEKHFVYKGLISGKFSNLKKRWARYYSGLLDEKGITEEIAFMEDFSQAVTDLHSTMDANMKFAAEKEMEAKEGKPEPAEAASAEPTAEKGEADVFMDLRGVKCPINYVKAKIRLETMQAGQTLRIYLDDGEPIKNVPTSLSNDGQEIVRQEQTAEGHFDLIVKKAA